MRGYCVCERDLGGELVEEGTIVLEDGICSIDLFKLGGE